MSPPAFRRVALVCAALAACACFGSYERAVEETRAGLIGLSGRDLRKCLGVPTDFDREEGLEFLTYRWVFDRNRDRPGTTHIGSGGVGGIVIGRRDAGGGYDPLGFPQELDEKEFCELDFVLAKGGVTQVTAHGRDQNDQRTDGPCLMRARRCIDERARADTEK